VEQCTGAMTRTANVFEYLGRQFQLTFESPKSEDLSLFRHGQLAYDHLILTPPKSKGGARSRRSRLGSDCG